MNYKQTWSITQIECTKSYDELVTSSNRIHWKLTTQNVDGYVYTIMQMGAVDTELTTEQCLSLTPADALSIAKQLLGDSVPTLEASGITQLENIMIPVVEEVL